MLLYLFLFFCFVKCGNGTCKSGSLRRPHATYPTGAFEHIFCWTLQEKTLLSRGALDIRTRADPKTLPKKWKKLERGPGGEPLPAAWALKIDGV